MDEYFNKTPTEERKIVFTLKTTLDLHPFLRGGTRKIGDIFNPSQIYFGSQFEHLFSDYPQTHYLGSPDKWQELREKIARLKKDGATTYEGVLEDINGLLNDIFILSFCPQRQYWENKQNKENVIYLKETFTPNIDFISS